MSKSYAQLKKLEDKNNETEFRAEIPLEILEENMDEALKEFTSNFQLPGFRKGKVPKHLVKEHVREMDFLEDATDNALNEAVREIVEDEKLVIVGNPQVAITKIVLKSPVEFKIRFALYPAITLPDYKKIGRTIAARKDSAEPTDKELQKAIDQIRKMLAGRINPDSSDSLPELTDEFAQKLGPFKNVEEFKAEIKKQLVQEKELHLLETRRDEMVKEITKQSKLKIPQLLINQELQEFRTQRDEQLKEAGISLDDYIKQVGKTIQDIEKNEQALTEERIRLGLVLRAIRQNENIIPMEDRVRENLDQLRRRYPDRQEEDLRQSAEAFNIQEQLFDLLEGKEVETSDA